MAKTIVKTYHWSPELCDATMAHPSQRLSRQEAYVSRRDSGQFQFYRLLDSWHLAKLEGRSFMRQSMMLKIDQGEQLALTRLKIEQKKYCMVLGFPPWGHHTDTWGPISGFQRLLHEILGTQRD
jgi:hypothetical protein